MTSALPLVTAAVARPRGDSNWGEMGDIPAWSNRQNELHHKIKMQLDVGSEHNIRFADTLEKIPVSELFVALNCQFFCFYFMLKTSCTV